MIGNSGRPGILAFVIHNLLAVVAAFVAVAALKSVNPYVSAGTLSLAYLGYFFLSEALWSRTPGKYLQRGLPSSTRRAAAAAGGAL